MGARGTDVAREAAALVLLNDDFSSIVTAVWYGRRVFTNLRKAVVFIVALHVPIVGLSIAPALLGWPMLLLPVHILFLQLIIDPACSVVFEAEPLEADGMKSKPRRPDARLFDAAAVTRGLWQGVGLLVLLLSTYALARRASGSDDIARAHCARVVEPGTDPRESVLEPGCSAQRRRGQRPLRLHRDIHEPVGAVHVGAMDYRKAEVGAPCGSTAMSTPNA